jgi:hypothetical protein
MLAEDVNHRGDRMDPPLRSKGLTIFSLSAMDAPRLRDQA